jgi:replicative DNA helicase
MSNVQKSQEQGSRRRGPGHVIDLEQGKLPPQAIELEEAVLGALLIDNEALDEVIDIINGQAFYKDGHKEIYEAINRLFNASKPIDVLTVAQDLREAGKLDVAGGEYYLAQLTQKVSSSAHVEFHARIIIEKFIQRELIRISNEIIKEAYDETSDVLDLLDDAEQKIFEIAEGNIKKNYDTAESLIQQALHNIEEISKKEGLSGVPSGFASLDKLTGGWQNSDLVILAARPGMGKTAFVLSMARNMAITHSTAVGVFSLEMSSVQLITRLISSETGLESDKLRKGNLEAHEWEQLNNKIQDLEKAPLFIDDTPALSIFDLRAKCRRLVAQHNVGIIIIDYLQLMTTGSSSKGGNREQEISTISRSLKSIAKELNVPVIALSQLSRAVETRGGSKRPLLSDLRESGAIEQDADIVSFIYRPEYYGMTEWDDDQSPCQGQAEFIVAKHRNGGLDNIRLKFINKLAKFTDLEDDFIFQGIVPSKMNDDPNDYPDDSPF